ncbi:glycosyltransferase family 61 protein [Ureibacillus aquaedulcis]|uniref:Glycosyltransferase family 61 protein n=1 Tax=Ureibacillus aquaedulcis TaxID=3058421 RepID=A0ABT8GLU5_9BACL|nr:glycosyltransferase family 61 protein [Ureibacillus sp. BA0131]MDN4492209.1 glycosyltransferase family 61 protein [Ureibacillus sp. BA0131]
MSLLLKEIVEGKKLILFGTGTSSKRYTEFLKNQFIEVAQYTDNNSYKWGTIFMGKKIVPPSELLKDKVLILIASMFRDEIAQQLLDMGLKPHKDFIYYDNFFKDGIEYKYISEGNELPNISSVVNIGDYASENSDTFKLEVLIENQFMKDLSKPNLLQTRQYPSFLLPQQPKPTGPVYVATMKEGYTYDHTGAIFDKHGNLIFELSTFNTLNINLWDAQRVQLYEFNKMINPPVSVYVEGVVGVATSIWGGDNFYHWMFEELPRFYLLNKSGKHIDKYVSHFEGTKFQIETLKLLGIDLDKVIFSSKNFAIHANELIIPYAPAFDSGYIPTWICDFLKSLQIDNIDKQRNDSPERIYIARGKANHKRVVNEDVVIDLLQKHNFKICYLEDYTLSEQASLFYHAKVIIAAHGAGLSHLVYCQPGTKLLEIFNPVYVPTMFWAICSQLDIDYYCSIGEKTEYIYTEEINETINIKDIIASMDDIKTFISNI